MGNEYKLHIGSYGWQYQSWENSFYPEDLPGEWQFAYYANEYSVIMIPWKLLKKNFTLLEQGIEDSEETCRVIFEIPINNINSRSDDEILTELQEFLNQISFVGTRALGVVVVLKYSELCNLTTKKYELLTKFLKMTQSKMNTCIDLQEITESGELAKALPEPFLVSLKQLKIGFCRYNDSNDITHDEKLSKFHITFCDSSNNDPKQMRKIVENSLVGECEASSNVLIFRTEIPSHEQMNTASVISDLL